jgi:hypothetical protein
MDPDPAQLDPEQRSRSAAWWTAVGTVILALVAVAGITHEVWPRGAPSHAPEPAPSITITSPGTGSAVPQHLAEFSGAVAHLRPGDAVWAFFALANSSTVVYPEQGPCSIKGNDWSCPFVYVGPNAASTDTYEVFVAVVSSTQASYDGHFVATHQTIHLPALLPQDAVPHAKIVVHRCGAATISVCS